MKKLIFLFSLLLSVLIINAQTYIDLEQNTTADFYFNPYGILENCHNYQIKIDYFTVVPLTGNVGTVIKTWPVNATTYQSCNPYITLKGVRPGYVKIWVRGGKRLFGTFDWTNINIYFFINIICPSSPIVPDVIIGYYPYSSDYNYVASISPANTPNQYSTPIYSWALNGNNVASGVGLNTHFFSNLICGDTINCIITFDNYCFQGDVYSNAVIVTTNCITSIEDPILTSSNAIYPIPFIDNINLKINALKRFKTTIVLTDVLGKIYKNKEVELIIGENDINLFVNCPKGIYFLSLISDNKTVTYKIIK